MVGIIKTNDIQSVDSDLCESITSYIYDSNVEPKKKVYEITTIYENNVKKYACGNKIYSNYDEAARCLKKKNRRVRFGLDKIKPFNRYDPPVNIKYIPPSKLSVINNGIIPNDACVLGLFSKKCVTNNMFSNKVWNKIWAGSDPKFYSKNSFSHFKLKLFKELNFYRAMHNAYPLFVDKTLTFFAQSQAYELSKNEMLYLDSISSMGEVVGFLNKRHISYLMKMWYDEILWHNFNLEVAQEESYEFSSLMWKTTKFIGIGIVERGDFIYICLKLSPKGNINGLFKNNISKSKKLKT
ncbi:CAP domain-containing protein [Strongyloides ratti]|uniref:CAP domain-containing protein n=1 Tax=Strongyloides ratti TaxID=34506 RepID=A0A090LGI9_STRRB|nr:CAP domain-containing protein [Strongyloides ratti]CEF66635.1 CAP domain-containing protein [Strongyloides ratti]